MNITERFERARAAATMKDIDGTELAGPKEIEFPKAEKTRDVPRYESPVAAQQAARTVTEVRFAAEAPKRVANEARAQQILSELDPSRAAFLKKMEARNAPLPEANSNVVDLNARATEAKMQALRDANNVQKEDARRWQTDYDKQVDAGFRNVG